MLRASIALAPQRAPSADVQFACRPWNEVFPVRSVGVAAVMLAPGEAPIEQARIHGRFEFFHVVIGGCTKPLLSQQAENRTGGHRRHEAALLVEPQRIALFGNAIADEGGA